MTTKPTLPPELDPETVAQSVYDEQGFDVTDEKFVKAGMLVAYRDVLDNPQPKYEAHSQKLCRDRIAALEAQDG